MLTRWLQFIAKLQISAAINFSRGFAGGFGGGLFAANAIFKLPLHKFLYGLGPACTTFLVSIAAFFAKLKMNFQEASPTAAYSEFKNAEDVLSTKKILNCLEQNENIIEQFLFDAKITKKEIARIQNWHEKSRDQLQDVWLHLYREVHSDPEKYLVCSLHTFLLMGSHFMELMMLEVFSPDYFNFDDFSSLKNLPVYMLTFSALFNGVVEFCRVKDSYEIPDKARLYEGLFNALQAYKKSHPVAENREPELCIGM